MLPYGQPNAFLKPYLYAGFGVFPPLDTVRGLSGNQWVGGHVLVGGFGRRFTTWMLLVSNPLWCSSIVEVDQRDTGAWGQFIIVTSRKKTTDMKVEICLINVPDGAAPVTCKMWLLALLSFIAVILTSIKHVSAVWKHAAFLTSLKRSRAFR